LFLYIKTYQLMRKIIYLLISLNTFFGVSQSNWTEFTGKQKAYFYQLSRKIENLEPEFFHLFEYTDSIPYINDTLPDYPYVEKRIVADSTKLILHTTELSRKNNGLISDMATHFASWELDLTLQFRNSTKSKFDYLKPKLKAFNTYVLEKAPQSAIKTLSDGSYELSPTVLQYYTPNLTIGEKIASIKNSAFSTNDQLLIIKAIYYAQEKYINTRSLEIFKILGGKTDSYNNYLIAAGDGNGWSDLESVMRPKYSRALPDPKSLFKFETVIEKNNKKKKTTNAPEILKIKDTHAFSSKTSSTRPTKIHFDVWGYHPERQTTIVIQKGGNSYILYGNNDDRYLCPDSTFDGGSTYWRLIDELKNVHIAQLKEMIYGKKGYDYWIAEYKVMIDKTLLDIKESEERLDKMRYAPIPPPKMKKKKIKKKNLGYSDQDNTGHAVGKMSGAAKKKNKEQSRLIHLNTQLLDQQRKLKQLIIDKDKAFDVLAAYQTKLDKMLANVGHTFVEFKTSKNGITTFDDGSTFNETNQDFTFNPDYRQQNFDIITIAYGEKVFSKTIEEVFVHMNITYPDPNSKYTFYSDYELKKLPKHISVSDSIQINELFTALGTTKLKLNVTTFGGGILAGKSHYYYRDSLATTTPYNKEITNQSTIYEQTIFINPLSQHINLSTTCYRHNMIPFNFNQKQGKYFIKAKAKNNKLNEIDYYTALLAKKRMDDWLIELEKYANKWLINTDYQAKVLNQLKKAKNKNNYSVTSNTKIKLPKK